MSLSGRVGHLGELEMKAQSPQSSKKGIYAALAGTILIVLCCFAPILVITFGAAVLSALTPYLGYLLIPALVLLILLTFMSYKKWEKRTVRNKNGFNDFGYSIKDRKKK